MADESIKNRRKFRLGDRARSIGNGARGLRILLSTQHNAWIHALATVAVCITGLYFGLTRAEWCWIVIAIMGVWMAEAMNTALEFLADAACPDDHPLIGKAKDVAAGAVLVAAIASVVIGLLVIGPYFLDLFRD